ncbi:L-PSP endoribonuclease family protein [Delphinella strobiligena]|nr:L-PSP endoribonuclease family protein [Delphinella strobiligena]
MSTDIRSILSDKACAFPAGLFHHAKVFNDVIYTTGQIGGDVTGKLVSNEVGAQAEQMFANLSAILEAAGSSLDRVLTANIYLTDSANYAALNEVYTRLMPDPKPPRTCVFVKGLPAGALCEMTLTAAAKS